MAFKTSNVPRETVPLAAPIGAVGRCLPRRPRWTWPYQHIAAAAARHTAESYAAERPRYVRPVVCVRPRSEGSRASRPGSHCPLADHLQMERPDREVAMCVHRPHEDGLGV